MVAATVAASFLRSGSVVKSGTTRVGGNDAYVISSTASFSIDLIVLYTCA